MMLAIVHLLDWITMWFLRNGKAGLDIGSHVDRFAEGIEKLGAGLKDVLPGHYLEDLKSHAADFSERGVPEAMAMRVAGLINMFSAPDIVALAEKRKMPVAAVAKLYFAIGARFRLGRLRAAAEKLDARSHWQKLAVAALIEETYAHQLALADQVITVAAKKSGTPTQAVDAWADSKKVLVEQTDRLLNDLWAGAISDLSMVAVASRQLRALSS
jgi:glutamate dehydrogenase